MRWPFLLLASLLGLLAARPATAIPPFARKYGASCALCHAPAYPALNGVGRAFKERGYQLEPEAEAQFRALSALRPDPEQPLELLQQAPLALRAQSRFVATPDAREVGGNALDLAPFDALYLIAGASLFPRVSFFASATLAPQVALHHATIGFHDLLSPRGWLNLRVGRRLVLDFARPEHRKLTGFGNPIATTPVGLNPTVLDSTQHGLEAHGRLLWRRIFYRLGLVQGAQGSDGLRDLDGHKDFFVELQGVPHHRVMVGGLAYRGRTQITDRTRGLETRFTDPFTMLAGTAELDTAPVNLFAQAVYVEHRNPEGTGEHTNYWGFRAEARAPLGARLFFVGRYDMLRSHHLQSFDYATVHLGCLLLTNLRVALESSAPLREIEASTVSLRLEAAL
jgi:hypothetical protein